MTTAIGPSPTARELAATVCEQAQYDAATGRGALLALTTNDVIGASMARVVKYLEFIHDGIEAGTIEFQEAPE